MIIVGWRTAMISSICLHINLLILEAIWFVHSFRLFYVDSLPFQISPTHLLLCRRYSSLSVKEGARTLGITSLNFSKGGAYIAISKMPANYDMIISQSPPSIFSHSPPAGFLSDYISTYRFVPLHRVTFHSVSRPFGGRIFLGAKVIH